VAAGSESAALVGDREIAATRVFDAPRELVWKVWTDPEQVGNGGAERLHHHDPQDGSETGGVWRFVMHGPDGRDYQNKITYLEW